MVGDVRARWVGAAAALTLTASLVIAAPAGASTVGVRTDDYPTWSQVQKAQRNAAAAKAELSHIRGLVAQLQQAANAAMSDVLAKNASYNQAKSDLDAATLRADTLAAQAKAADQKADTARAQFGRLAAQMYVSGGTDMTARLLVSTGADDNLLDRLGAMSQLTGQLAGLQTRARSDRNLARSFSAQAASAEKARASLATAAKKKLASAQAAQQQADALLAQQQSAMTTLTAQAASLAGTSADIEKKYQEGVDYRKQQASEGGSNASAGGGNVIVDPAAAKAYARSRLSAYGWSDSQYGCLVDLWTMESGWRADAYNTSSGAYGIPQAWPGNKMASAGADWQTNARTQINWGLGYISAAYGSPCRAWDFEMSHDPHWY